MDPRQIELAKRYREDPEFRAFFAKRWKETFGYDFGSAPDQPTRPEQPQEGAQTDSDDDDYEPSEDSSDVSSQDSDDDAVEEEQDETGITYKMRDYEDEF